MKANYKPLDLKAEDERTETVEFALPWPPSLNHNWRIGKTFSKNWTKPRVYRSDAYEKFLGRVFAAACDGRIPAPKRAEFYDVELIFIPPDLRKYDVDNRVKAVFDALTKTGFWKDDAQVRVARLVKTPARQDKRSCVLIKATGRTLPPESPPSEKVQELTAWIYPRKTILEKRSARRNES